MKKLLYIFTASVVLGPIIFAVYYQNGLVCAPRAILSSALFGLVPLALAWLAQHKQIEALYHASLLVLVAEMISTPIIMIGRLGWDKYIADRQLAFFTFEGFAVLQFFLVVLMLVTSVRMQSNTRIA